MIDNKKIEDVAKVYMIGEFYDRDEAEWNYPITNEEKRNQCIIVLRLVLSGCKKSF